MFVEFGCLGLVDLVWARLHGKSHTHVSFLFIRVYHLIYVVW